MLLPLAGRPMLDYLLDRIREVEEIDEIHLVTNSRFAPAFRDWASADVTVHDDGTTSNDDRLGAIGDLAFTIERAGLGGEDLLVVAGDNLIGYSLPDYVAFWRGEGRQCDRAARGRGPRAPQELRRRRARRRRPGRRLRGEARRAEEQSRRDRRVPLPRRGPRPAPAVPRRGQPAGCAGKLRRLAAHARARLRLPLRRRVARHRRPRPAARGGQPAPGALRPAAPDRVLARLTKPEPKP